jgi:hypothetical protein
MTVRSGLRVDFIVETYLVPALIVCAVLIGSVRMGVDGSWDLRNYHIYNAFALLHKAPGTDLVPAQMQSFLSPTIDVVYYWIRAGLNPSPNLVDAIFGLPAAIAAVIAFRIGLLLLPHSRPGSVLTRRWLLVLLALLFGVTGSAGFPTIGASMTEMPAGCFVLGGLLVLLRTLNQERPWRWSAFVAGLLFGAAIGLKLTIMPFVIAGTVAFLLTTHGGIVARIGNMTGLGAGIAVGGALLGGLWWLHLYQLTGNPIFPYFNNVFRSPLGAPIAMEDNRFLPHGVVQALLYPFYWGFEKSTLVSEPSLRDPRIAFAGIALAAYAVTGVMRRFRPDSPHARAGLCLALFMAIGFVLWEAEFSIFRYLAPLELLSGFLILLALRPLLEQPSKRWLPLAGLSVLCLVTLPFTRYPQWGRTSPVGRVQSVLVPALPKGGMVLLLTGDPMAYIAAFTDPAIRFVGVNNNLVQPGGVTGVAKQVEAAVRAHTGPLWGLEIPDSTGQAEATLDYYGLRRGGECTKVVSNLEGPGIHLCPLQRVAGG